MGRFYVQRRLRSLQWAVMDRRTSKVHPGLWGFGWHIYRTRKQSNEVCDALNALVKTLGEDTW